MARVKFGGAVTEIRGRFEGLVYSSNNFGAFVRAQKKPVNTKSALQTLNRGLFSQGVEKWRALADADKLLWDAYAAAPPEADYDYWGNQIYLSGYQWALRVWQRQFTVGDTLIDVPGSDVPVTGLVNPAFSIDYGTSHADLEYDNTTFGVGDTLIVYGYLGRMGSQRVSYKNYYLTFFGTPASDTLTNLYAYITSFVGFIQQGQFYTIKAQRQTTDGIRSPEETFTGYVT